MYVKRAGALYRLLGDEARLRVLRALAGRHGRLNVTELTAVLGIAQSGVSRHLRLLKEAGLVVEERGGGFSYYRLSPALLDGGFGGLWPALQTQFTEAAHTPAVRADEARLQEVIRLREREFRSARHRSRPVRPRSKLGGLVPRAGFAPASRRCRRHRVRRGISGGGIRALGSQRCRHRSVERRAQAREGARAPPWREEHLVEARRHGEAAARERERRRGAALAGAAPCCRSLKRPSSKRRGSSGPAAGSSYWIYASTIKNGFATAWAIAGSDSPTSSSSSFSPAPACAT